jgi:hypothetical protein
MTVSSHVDPTRTFSQDRTFQWGPADALPTGDSRLDGDRYFQDRMQGAVERQLAGRGIALTSANADLLVHYHANISHRVDVDGVDRGLGYGAGGDAPAVTTYEAGTLVIDVIDRRTNRLVWRGWAQTNIEDALADPSRLAAVIDEATARMLERFPRTTDAAIVPPVK